MPCRKNVRWLRLLSDSCSSYNHWLHDGRGVPDLGNMRNPHPSYTQHLPDSWNAKTLTPQHEGGRQSVSGYHAGCAGSLRTPPTRGEHALSGDPRQRRNLLCPDRARDRDRPASVCQRRVRRISGVRNISPRISACTVWGLRP